LYTYATSGNGYGSMANLANVGSDFVATVATGSPIRISVTSVGGTALATAVTGNYTAAQ
jgi:hypothetical protein